MAGAKVSVVSQDLHQGVETVADAHGNYQVRVDKPALYSVRAFFTGSTAPQAAFHIAAKAGDNVLNMDIIGGRITVRVRGVDGRAPARVTLRRGMDVFNGLADGSGKFDREGLPLGEYLVSATQTGAATRVSGQTARVTLTAQDPDSIIDVELVHNRSTLQLRDASGQPVTGASLLVGILPSPRFVGGPQSRGVPVVTGTYSLDSFAPGTEVQVQPGGDKVPVCIVVPLNEDMIVTTRQGSALTIAVPLVGVEQLVLGLGVLEGVPGSQCSVPMTRFDVRPSTGPAADRRYFTIANFPADAPGVRWSLTLPEGRYSQSVSGERTRPFVVKLARQQE